MEVDLVRHTGIDKVYRLAKVARVACRRVVQITTPGVATRVDAPAARDRILDRLLPL